MQPFPGTTTEPLPECQPSPEHFKLVGAKGIYVRSI